MIDAECEVCFKYKPRPEVKSYRVQGNDTQMQICNDCKRAMDSLNEQD